MVIDVLGVPLNGWAALTLTVQFVLPMLVGLVTTKETNRGRQFALLTGLTLVATVITQVIEQHEKGLQINIVQIVVSAVVNLVVSLLSHYGVWKPTNLSALMLAMFNQKPTDTPPPLNPSPNPAIADLPARHLYVAPTFRERDSRGGDHVLERDTA